MDLAQSYNAAREAVSYRAVYGASRAINIKEIAPKESGEPCFTNDMELLNLFKKIRLNSEEEIVEAVDQYIESISAEIIAAASCGDHGVGNRLVSVFCK